MLAFWNGKGGDIWVARQEHTDITLAPVTDALLAFAAPRAGERVADIGCGCGAPTLAFARAVDSAGAGDERSGLAGPCRAKRVEAPPAALQPARKRDEFARAHCRRPLSSAYCVPRVRPSWGTFVLWKWPA